MKALIIKYLTHSLTDSELEQLLDWLKKPKNLREFQVLVKDNFNLNMVYDDIDEEVALQKVKRAIQNKERRVRSLPLRVFKYAAAILIFISAGLFFLTRNTTQITEPVIVNNTIETGTNKAILTIEDGTEVTLIKGKDYASNYATSTGDALIYAKTKARQDLVYNYLTVPRGGQYFIKLEDGTQVWLNSESRLKYPVSFIDGDVRQVELIYGEAYFDVSPSTAHQGDAFKVIHKEQEVEVLGTAFNIKAYSDEDYVYTSLVEGKVAITNFSTNHILLPEQQSRLNISDKQLSITSVEIYDEISWKDGIFSFNEKPLNKIMKTLSRWYDLEVVFDNPELKHVEFVGVLGKDQNIEVILNAIKNSSIITNYEIYDKTIILK